MADKKKAPTPSKPSGKVVVELRAPLKGEEKFITASVNGKVWKIQKGVAVEIPRELAEVLNNANEEAMKADSYAEKIVNATLEKEQNI